VARHARPAGKARPWRSRLHRFVRAMASDDWEGDEAGTAGPSPVDPQGGAHASLDEVLREAAEARHPHDADGPEA
jgi:hypothetical protein